MSCPGALERDLWITTQREQILAALKAIAVMPVSAALGRDEEVESPTKGHLSLVANHGASGTAPENTRTDRC